MGVSELVQIGVCPYSLCGLCPPNDLSIISSGQCQLSHSVSTTLTMINDDEELRSYKHLLLAQLDEIVSECNKRYFAYSSKLISEYRLESNMRELSVLYDTALKLHTEFNFGETLSTLRVFNKLNMEVKQQTIMYQTERMAPICEQCGFLIGTNHFFSPAHKSAVIARLKLDQLKKELNVKTIEETEREEREYQLSQMINPNNTKAPVPKMQTNNLSTSQEMVDSANNIPEATATAPKTRSLSPSRPWMSRSWSRTTSRSRSRSPTRSRFGSRSISRSRAGSYSRSRSRSRGRRERDRDRERDRERGRGRSISRERTRRKKDRSPYPARNDYRRKIICKYFVKGYCFKKDACEFKHTSIT